MVIEVKPRSQKTYAYLAGIAVTSEAYHPTAPEPAGRGAKVAMLGALSDAGVTPTQVQSVFAHGTGTALNDPAETKAMIAGFGNHSSELRITSTKGATGHTLGGAGAINAVLACLSLARESLPPNAGFVSGRKGCSLPIADRRVLSASRSAFFLTHLVLAVQTPQLSSQRDRHPQPCKNVPRSSFGLRGWALLPLLAPIHKFSKMRF